jgi:hypothetical protein
VGGCEGGVACDRLFVAGQCAFEAFSVPLSPEEAAAQERAVRVGIVGAGRGGVAEEADPEALGDRVRELFLEVEGVFQLAVEAVGPGRRCGPGL